MNLLLIAPLPLFCATSKSGLIFDERWTKAEAPYIINGDVQIVSLTIEPGVEVRCTSNIVFEIAGWLKASGTATERIRFVPAVESERWQGIFFNFTGDDSELSYCTVEGANNSGVRVFYGSPVISQCVVTNNTSPDFGGGFNLWNCFSVISNSVVSQNSGARGGGVSIRNDTTNACWMVTCHISLNQASGQGGGVFTSGGALILANSQVISNTASFGAGLRATYGAVTVLNSALRSNWAEDGGGGIACLGGPLVARLSIIAQNRARSHGGGIRFEGGGECSLEDTAILENVADSRGGSIVGGGLFLSEALLSVVNCEVAKNRVITPSGFTEGGGLYLEGASSGCCLVNTRISENFLKGTSSDGTHGGAGVFVVSATVGATNCVIADNTGENQFGDGLALRGGQVTLMNCNLVYNNYGAHSWNGNLRVMNSIIFFNSQQQVALFSGVPPEVSFTDIQGGYAGVGNLTQNPIFQSRTNFMLVTGSPCIDKGHTNSIYNDVCFPPSRGGERNDMGAYGGPRACDWITGEAPVVLIQPKSQSTCLGQEITLWVRATGVGALRYQWFYNETNLLSGQNSTNLTLNNIQKDQSGLYSVVVSNAFGTVASSSARILVFDACVTIGMYAGLSITGLVGRTYVVSSATDLNLAENWAPLATNTFTEPHWFFLDTESAFRPQRFYRVDLK